MPNKPKIQAQAVGAKQPVTIMRVAKNERVHKVFVIHHRPTAPVFVRDYRILTKETRAGTLELIAYQYETDEQSEWQTGYLRAPSVPPDTLVTLIRRLVAQTKTDIRQLEALDLTVCRTRLDQADKLAQHELLDAFAFGG